MIKINANQSGTDSQQLIVRAIIYLLALVSAVRGLLVYAEQWQALLFVLLPFIVVLAAERWIHKQSQSVKALYVAVQMTIVASLFFIAPLADYWALLLLPVGYKVIPWFGQRNGYAMLGLMITVMTFSLWRAEGGLVSLQFSSVYAVAYLMVGSFSYMLEQAIVSRRKAEALTAELEQTNIRLRRYAERSANSAILEERTALARELHDSATQTVFSINLLINSLEHTFQKNPEKLPADIQQIASLSDTAMKQLRAIINQLKPASPAPLAFTAALRTMLSELEGTHQLNVKLNYDDSPVPRYAAHNLLAIIREALMNVIKHSNMASAHVDIYSRQNQLQVCIEDDGVGFDNTQNLEPGHMGIESMRLNSLDLGGTITVHSTPGSGTRIQLDMPIHRESPQESSV